jgi:hypothetical protein
MANALDNLVEKFGGYEELSNAERETYKEHLKVIEGKPVTVEDTKKFVRSMITLVERLLVDALEATPESINLKARLKNLLMLEQFLFAPDRAREALEGFYKER